MIAFDIDGVFLSDQDINAANIEDILRVRSNYLKPLFVPKGDYVLITGRPAQDKEDTQRWVNKFFDRKPLCVYHENTDMRKSAQYKAAVLNENKNIHCFLESDRSQAEVIRSLTNTKIIVFEDLIYESLLAL